MGFFSSLSCSFFPIFDYLHNIVAILFCSHVGFGFVIGVTLIFTLYIFTYYNLYSNDFMHVSTVHFIVSCLELCIIVVACFVFTSIIVLRLHVTINVCLNNSLSLKRGKWEKEKYKWMHLLPLVLFFCHWRTCGLPLCLYLFIFLCFPFLVFICMPVLCMHVSMCMFLCVCSRLCIYVLSICVHVCVHVCVFTSVSVCVYVFMHVCTCAHAQSPGLLLGVFPLICHLTHWRQDLSITPRAHWYSMHDRPAFSRDPLPQPP